MYTHVDQGSAEAQHSRCRPIPAWEYRDNIGAADMRGRMQWCVYVCTMATLSISISAWATGVTERVSVSSGGRQGNQDSSGATVGDAMTRSGRLVVFESDASNLVAGDTNGASDVFLRDSAKNRTWRVSLARDGTQGNGDSFGGAISADGRVVAFVSDASNLVPHDTNGTTDVFVRDLQTGIVRRVNVGPGGRQADGRSFGAAISADGRFVAFSSEATNLVSGDTNGAQDIFTHDLIIARRRWE